MRVLVLGGTGFVGRSLVPVLQERGHQVVIYHRGQTEFGFGPEVEHVHGDRRDIGDRTGDVDVEAVIDIRPMNGVDSEPVVEAFRGRIKSSVHLSSMDVYRAWSAVQSGSGAVCAVPFTEKAAVRDQLFIYRGRHPALHDYEKLLMERTVLTAGAGFPAAVVRLPVVYGPHDRQRREWPIMKRLMDSVPIVMGGGSSWLWQRTHVREAARAIAAVMVSPGAMGHVFNVGEQATLTLAQWTRAIATALGVRADIRLIPDSLLPPHLEDYRTQHQHILGDTTKLRRITGYADEETPYAWIASSVAWHLDNPPPLDRARYVDELRLEAQALDRAAGAEGEK